MVETMLGPPQHEADSEGQQEEANSCPPGALLQCGAASVCLMPKKGWRGSDEAEGWRRQGFLQRREEGILGRRDSIYKNAFRSEENKYGSRLDGGVKLEVGQVRKLVYIYSIIYSKNHLSPLCLRSYAKGLGALVITQSMKALNARQRSLGLRQKPNEQLKLWSERSRMWLAG